MLTIYLALVIIGLFLSVLNVTRSAPIVEHVEIDRVFWQARYPARFEKLPKIWQDIVTDYDLIGDDCFKLYRCDRLSLADSVRNDIADSKATIKIGRPVPEVVPAVAIIHTTPTGRTIAKFYNASGKYVGCSFLRSADPIVHAKTLASAVIDMRNTAQKQTA